MGYSCTKNAGDTLAVIRNLFDAKGKGSNVLLIKGAEYFFERGKEQPDGAITGQLFKLLPNEKCLPAGTFRINGDGSVARFPGLTKDQREEAENTMRDMQARNPHLLSNWSMGVL